jgi:hypothetical protein
MCSDLFMERMFNNLFETFILFPFVPGPTFLEMFPKVGKLSHVNAWLNNYSIPAKRMRDK